MKTFNKLSVPEVDKNIFEVEVQEMMCEIVISEEDCTGLECDYCIYFYRNLEEFKKWLKESK